MASVLVHHVIGDLTLGKPEIKEFADSETVEAAVKAIGECAEGAITVWKANDGCDRTDGIWPRASRFVGILHSMDLVAFLAKAGEEHERAMRTPVAEVVKPNPTLLKEVDPGTRLIDALELMKQGVRRLLVRKSIAWKGVSKRFSILYHGKWLKTLNTSTATTPSNSGQSSSSSFHDDKYCCLSREDVVRFLIGCLGALAPIPLSSISSLGAITPRYFHIEASSPAIEVAHKLPQDPCVIAVVETNPDGSHKIIGEISAYKLWKCDYLAASWALANLSAGQFVMGAEDNITASDSLVPNLSVSSPIEDTILGASLRPKKFSSRSIGFFSSQANQMAVGGLGSMYRGRSAPLTCKHTSSLAAVMAQMLSHRATHVWVTDAEVEDDILIGIISYSDILHAVTKHPGSLVPTTP
ncbi:hypothetical protein J5N97_020560 [Dioscorea zingiberensis]|uniref:CBS domain-containing protein n=1 Tax=Dioscorea zingiberensis TaxID=325984 RepID=A0A9D5HDC5_9LILI|nr:hypothetical protein J5N97_020560 [Dioscorea zingiberensis]